MLQKTGVACLFALAFVQVAKAEESPRVERRVQYMTKQLTLTPEQQIKLKAVFEDDEKQRELHRAEFKKQLDAILTPEQKAKMEENWQKRKDKRKSKKGEPPVDDLDRVEDDKK